MQNNVKPELSEIYQNAEIKSYIKFADQSLGVVGLTEHGQAHAKKCSQDASDLLFELGYPKRICELAAISGYMHDIGNVINRSDHAQSGALMAFTLLQKLGMEHEEVAQICSAIGHHDEKTAFPVNPIAAALIISDKSDVRRSRVRKNAVIKIDIHDRVNFAVENTSLKLSPDKKACIFKITIDTEICPVMEYFEIFLERMILCRKAAEFLGLQFELIINHTRLL